MKIRKTTSSIIFLMAVLLLVACDPSSDSIPSDQALIVRNQHPNGALKQTIAADVTEQVSESITTAAEISEGIYEEESLDFQELFILFPRSLWCKRMAILRKYH